MGLHIQGADSHRHADFMLLAHVPDSCITAFLFNEVEMSCI